MDQHWFVLSGDGIATLKPAAPFLRRFFLSAKPFFPIYSFRTLVINYQSFPLKHDVETGTAKSLPLACYLPQALAQDSIILRLRLVMIDRSRNIDQQAGFPFT